jgi:transcriptional regulator with XRE-family HTH domain
MDSVERAGQEVAAVLAELLQKERLTAGKLARLSGLSRATPYGILRGRSKGDPTTLQKIARGLATDPYSGKLDQAKYIEYAGRLLRPWNLAPVVVAGELVAEAIMREDKAPDAEG